jgi:hypothetical protein
VETPQSTRKSLNMLSFCDDSIHYSFDSLDDIKNCKDSTFVAPLHQFEFIKAKLFKKLFYTHEDAEYKYSHDDLIRPDYHTEDEEFNINKVYEADSISLFEAFVLQVFEISTWTKNNCGE